MPFYHQACSNKLIINVGSRTFLCQLRKSSNLCLLHYNLPTRKSIIAKRVSRKRISKKLRKWVKQWKSRFVLAFREATSLYMVVRIVCDLYYHENHHYISRKTSVQKYSLLKRDKETDRDRRNIRNHYFPFSTSFLLGEMRQNLYHQ